jgi:type IV secretory pathway VirB10-like protein
LAIVSVIVLLLVAFAYGGYRRTLTNQAAARDAGLPRNVTPATQAGREAAGSAVGQELSQTGAQITRRNLNVQPTIKVPAGYKFTVRVNRDILSHRVNETENDDI